MHHGPPTPWASALSTAEWLTLLVIAAGLLTYLAAALKVWSAGRSWSLRRLLCWLAGCTCVALATSGPVAAAHHDFTAHMVAHLLLGMVGPLLLVQAAPIALLLRTAPRNVVRRVVLVLRSGPAAFLTHPAVAASLVTGSLWALYRTSLYRVVTANPQLHVLLHVHMLASGYLLTYALLAGPDPAPHRASPRTRAMTLFFTIAAHAVLAKLIYAQPPAGVSAAQAHVAAELMYYGAMPVELVLVVVTCRHLVQREERSRKAARPTTTRMAGPAG